MKNRKAFSRAEMGEMLSDALDACDSADRAASHASDTLDEIRRKLASYGIRADEPDEMEEEVERLRSIVTEIDICLGGTGATNGMRDAADEALRAARRVGERRREMA